MRKLKLSYQTPVEWVEKVVKDFPLFLADHAANERKAAASAMALVVQYPDRHSLVATAARIAGEEITHFRQVFAKMKRLGFPLQPDEKDPYVGFMLSHVRALSEDRLLDRLIVNSLIELRGLEKFNLLGKQFPKADWREFFSELGQSEEGHGYAFVKEAKKIFPEGTVEKRIVEFVEIEGAACRKTPLTYRFH